MSRRGRALVVALLSGLAILVLAFVALVLLDALVMCGDCGGA